MKEWWITLYGLYGTSFRKLADVDRETLERCLTGRQEYKLEEYTQEERNQLEVRGN